MDSLDERVENLKEFNAALADAISRLTGDTVSLQTGLKGFESVQTAWEKVADEESTGAFTATLVDLDTTVDEDVETAVAACTEVKTLVAEKETTELAAASKRADAEADAFGGMATEAGKHMQDAALELRKGAVALSDRAIYTSAALTKLETHATKAFADASETAGEIVSVLAKAMEQSASVARQHAAQLEPSSQSFASATAAFTGAVDAAKSPLTQSHAARGKGLCASYGTYEQHAQVTASRVQELLRAALVRYAGLLEEQTAAIGTNNGAVALDQALARVTGELARWRGRVEENRPFLAGLPRSVEDLRAAHRIAVKVVGVLDAL